MKNFNYLQIIWRSLSRRRRRQLCLLQVLTIFAAIAEVANIGALLPFLRLLASPSESLKQLGPLGRLAYHLPSEHLLLLLGSGFMLVVSFSTMLRVLTIRTQLRLAALLTADLGERAFSSVLARDYSWHLRTNSSEVLGFLTHDVEAAFNCVYAVLSFPMNIASVLFISFALLCVAPGFA